MHRIRFLALKEFYHIMRDPRSLAIALAMPVMMTFLYGYAINMDIEHVALAVIDHDHSAASQELIDDFYASRYFDPPATEPDPTDPDAVFRMGGANAILVINPGFDAALTRGELFELGLIIDGSDNNVASAVRAYANQLVAEYAIGRLPPETEIPGVRIATQILYNPDLKSSHFFVPALVAIIMLMISALLTSITIAREKETGTMEQLLTTPVRPSEILIGKILPYIAIALADGILVWLFARLIFGVPFIGSHLLLLAFGLVYISTSLAVGILISSLVSTQQMAMMLAITTTMLPSVMLSGFIFAIKNMPLILQQVTRIVPATYFIKIIRGIMLKGAGVELLYVQGLWLLGLMALMLVLATRLFKTRVA